MKSIKRKQHQCREGAPVQLTPPSPPLAEINLHLFSVTSHASHHLTPKKGLFLHTQSRTLWKLVLAKCVLSQFPSEEMYLAVSSVQWTLCNPTPGFPVHHKLQEIVQTHVHRKSDAIQPSHPLLTHSPAFNLSQDQGLFQWVSSSHQVAKVLELQHQSFQWVFWTDFL